jgi:hypothetical protein
LADARALLAGAAEALLTGLAAVGLAAVGLAAVGLAEGALLVEVLETVALVAVALTVLERLFVALTALAGRARDAVSLAADFAVPTLAAARAVRLRPPA